MTAAEPRTAFILVTGSRAHRDRRLITNALAQAQRHAQERGYARLVVVHGAARGADAIAGTWAYRHRGEGVEERRFPADWEGPCTAACATGHRRARLDGSSYCPAEGNRRNQRMVDHVVGVAEPDGVLVLAFPVGESSGTRDCIRRAQAAGLPVRVVEARQGGVQ